MSCAAALALLALAAERGIGKSFCPSEAARRLDPEARRARMVEVHEAARSIAAAGNVILTQAGREVEREHIRGPYRIRAAADPRLPSPHPEAYPASPASRERDSADA